MILEREILPYAILSAIKMVPRARHRKRGAPYGWRESQVIWEISVNRKSRVKETAINGTAIEMSLFKPGGDIWMHQLPK